MPGPDARPTARTEAAPPGDGDGPVGAARDPSAGSPAARPAPDGDADESPFRAVFAAIDEGFCVCEMIVDGDGRPVDYRFLEVNPPFEAMTGLADPVGKTAYELVPNLEPHWVAYYARAGLGGETLRFESGSEAMGRWFDVFAAPVAPRGRFALVFRDVTDRKRAEERLRASEEHFRGTFENAAVGIAHVDLDGRWRVVNQRLLDIVGYPEDELLTLRFPDITHPDDVAENLENARRVASGEIDRYTMEKRYVRKDGSIVWVIVSVSLARDAGGAPDYYIAVIQDVHARKQAEEERARLLERERERTLQLQKLAAAALAINAAPTVDATLRVITEQAREIIGAHQAVTSFTVDENLAQAINTISLSDAYAAYRAYDAAPNGSGIYRLVCEENRPYRLTQAELVAHPAWRGFGAEAGRHPPMRGWLAAPLVARDGRNLGLIQLSDRHAGDFTEEDEAILVQLAQLASVAVENARLFQQVREAVSARDQFLSIAAHELLTPIAALKGHTQTLQRAYARGAVDEARLARALASLDRNADRLTSLTRDLLDVARLNTGRLPIRARPLDLAALVRGVAGAYRERVAAGHALVVEADDALAPVSADPERVEQVLVNLLDNAQKYAPDGGVIRVRLAADGEGARLEVSDEGIGLPPGADEAIFQPFGRAANAERRAIPGMGLGLYISRQIVEQHGGRMWAASPGEERGTTVSVWLPARPRVDDSAAPATE